MAEIPSEWLTDGTPCGHTRQLVHDSRFLSNLLRLGRRGHPGVRYLLNGSFTDEHVEHCVSLVEHEQPPPRQPRCLRDSDALREQIVRRDADGAIDRWLTFDSLPYSDHRAAQVLNQFCVNELRYGTGSQRWFRWNGRVFEQTDTLDAHSVIMTLADALADALQEVKALFTGDEGSGNSAKDYRSVWREHRQYRDRLHSSQGIGSLRNMLREIVSFDDGDLDADTGVLVVGNGVIDLEHVRETHEVRLLPHDPVRLVSKHTPVDYDPDASAPSFSRFTETNIPHSGDRAYTQKFIGQALLGQPRHKGMLNVIGPTNTGKSLFISVLESLFGEYTRTIPIDALVERRGGGNKEYAINRLRGVRLAMTAELGQTHQLNDDYVKMITGNDTIQSRDPYGRYVTWQPQCVVVLASNHPLRFDSSDNAMGTRIKPVSFPYSFSDDPGAPAEIRKDVTLRDRIIDGELSGVLNWVLEGLTSYLDESLVDHSEMTARRERMIDEIESPFRFISELMEDGVLVTDSDASYNSCASVKAAFDRYVSWCDSVHERGQYGLHRFSAVVQRRYPLTNSPIGGRGKRFTGLRIADEERWENPLYRP